MNVKRGLDAVVDQSQIKNLEEATYQNLYWILNVPSIYFEEVALAFRFKEISI